MSVAGSQARTFLRLAAALQPHWRRDPALPRRIQALLAGERAFGSRDRRLYRELLYTTVRHLPWIEPHLTTAPDEAVRLVAHLAAELPATHRFRAEFARGPAPAGDKAELLPAWFREHCPEIFRGAELDAQLRRAPLWLRLQTDDAGRAATEAEFTQLGWRWQPSPLLPGALQLLDEVDVTRTEAWQSGRIEVQDLGSQLLLEAVGLAPGERWLDACAGAGGKSLQLARLLGPTGQVDAHDIRAGALDELRIRAQRAGARQIRVTPTLTGTYDGVLVDAPCSGSGTWRRSPHLKWTTTPEFVADRATLQLRLLEEFARQVRPGGRLLYATCSLSHVENEDVMAAFLAHAPDFAPEPFARTFDFSPLGQGLRIWPARYDTDGFFVASLRRSAG